MASVVELDSAEISSTTYGMKDEDARRQTILLVLILHVYSNVYLVPNDLALILDG